MKNILFLGSKTIGYECLKFLLENSTKLKCRVIGALSNNRTLDKSASIENLANEYKIPFISELNSILDIDNVDFIISVQYHLILKLNHIKVAKEMAINLHMAPLPEFRGCNQFSFAIYKDVKVFGTTMHRLETGIDNGAIIAERRFPLSTEYGVKELYDKTFEESLVLFRNNIHDILKGNYSLTNQEDLIPERGMGTYYRKDIEKLKSIDFNQSEKEIVGKVRATAMPGFEPPFAFVDGKKYYVIPENQYKKDS